MWYKYDSGTNLTIGRDCLEKQNCFYIIFERPGLAVFVDGHTADLGEWEGSLEISGSDCTVYIPKAKVSAVEKMLKAEEILTK